MGYRWFKDSYVTGKPTPMQVAIPKSCTPKALCTTCRQLHPNVLFLPFEGFRDLVNPYCFHSLGVRGVQQR